MNSTEQNITEKENIIKNDEKLKKENEDFETMLKDMIAKNNRGIVSENNENDIDQLNETENDQNETLSFEIALNLPKLENKEGNETQKQTVVISSSKSQVIIVCNGPNTRKGPNGLCECVEGFEYGDPFSRYGCYHCLQKCHEKASCKYPGKCVCDNGMIGDGTKQCQIPLPVMIDVEPKTVTAKGGDILLVQYFTESNYTQSHGYCKFGSTIVKGNISNQGELKCMVPPSSVKGQKVSVSFDSDKWSTKSVVLMYKKEFNLVKFLIQIGVVVLIIAGCVIYYFTREKEQLNSEIDQKAEKAPFYRQKFNPDDDFDTEL